MSENDSDRATPPPAGRRVSLLSVWALTSLALLAALILLLLLGDVYYLLFGRVNYEKMWQGLLSEAIAEAIWRSVYTSLITLVIVAATAVPASYALSRYRFPGHALANTLVDVPIVLPPVVVGVSLLALFGGMAKPIRDAMDAAGMPLDSALGIVLCQFLMSIPYAVRMGKSAFDAVDPRIEQVALTLGCTGGQAFRRITLPLAANGLLAGCVVAWARAVGVFGPLLVFVGTGPRVTVMPTAISVELSVGNTEVALAGALVMLLMAGAALALVHRLEPRGKGVWQ